MNINVIDKNREIKYKLNPLAETFLPNVVNSR